MESEILAPLGSKSVLRHGSWGHSQSGRMAGIRAICYIPGVPTYHSAPSRPRSGLLTRLRGIPDPLPTPRFSLHEDAPAT